MRSKKGRGTTVKVSLPLQSLASALSKEPRIRSFDFSSLPAPVRFLGFGAIGIDPAAEQSEAKTDRRLLSSMKRYCMQFGIPVHTAEDDTNNKASVHIISEQALKRSSQTNDSDLRRSLLSADNLRNPMIVICTTRESALRLRSGTLESGLHHATQYLWLPVGPAKLAGALSVCCM